MTNRAKSQILTLQEKLALALTSYGSVTRMARDMGITRSRLNGWLREGEEPLIDPSTGIILRQGGVKQIPNDFFIKKAINVVFTDHKKRAKSAAKFFDLPFSDDYPIFQFKKQREDGAPSDRTFVIGTEYLREDLRNSVLKSLVSSRKYYSMVGRSVINLHDYNRNAEKRPRGVFPRTDAQNEARKSIKRSIRKGEEFGVIYTKRMPLGQLGPGRWISPKDYTDQYTQLLRDRMEPSSGYEKAAMSDQLIFQLIPEGYYGTSKTKGKKRTKK